MTHVSKITEPRRRQARSVMNDARILDAVVERLDSGGWEETSLVQIARQAGLTHPAVLDRHDSRTTAVIDVWHQRLAPPLLHALRQCVAVLDTTVREDDLAAALDPFIYPEPRMRAAAEVLLVSRYEPALADAVASTLGPDLEQWLTPRRGRLTRAQAARHAFVLALALGSVVEGRRRLPSMPLDLEFEISIITRALNARVFPVTLPTARATHLSEPPNFGTDDPALQALLSATLEEIGHLGFEAATVKRIAERAGYTTGLIFRRYSSKRDLFLDATARMLTSAGTANHEFQLSLSDRVSPGVADATVTREFMRPELKELRTITYEQYRLSWHDAEMQVSFADAQEQVQRETQEIFTHLTAEQASARAFFALARGAGVGLVADLHDGAWQLPHDVVTVPLTDEDI